MLSSAPHELSNPLRTGQFQSCQEPTLPKVWIDLGNQPDVRTFSTLVHEIDDRLVTTRHGRSTEDLLRSLGIDHRVIGSHGGRNRLAKMVTTCDRIVRSFISVRSYGASCSLSLESITAALTSKVLLRIPHVLLTDNEYAREQQRVLLPNSAHIVYPSSISRDHYLSYGVPDSALHPFDGIKELMYVERREWTGAESDQIMLRLSAWDSSFLPQEEITFERDLVRDMVDACPDLRFIAPPRGPGQAAFLRTVGVSVPDRPLTDIFTILPALRAFVGMGDTMTREAVCLGVPTLYCRRSEPGAVNRMLVERGVLPHYLSAGELAAALRDADRLRELVYSAGRATRELESPREVILELVSRY